VKALAESIGKMLNDASATAASIEGIFENYRKTTPAFLDDFLAPEGIITQKRQIDARIRECKEGVVEKRSEIARLRADNEELNQKIGEYRATLENLRVNRAQAAAQAEAAKERARLLQRELAGQEAQLKTINDELYLVKKRFEEVNERISDTETEIASIEERGKKMAADLDKLQKDIDRRNSETAGKKDALERKRGQLARANEQLERINLALAQSETEIKNVQDNFRENHSRDLLEFEPRMLEIKETPAALREKLMKLREDLKSLGQVNLMAVEEFAETKEHYEFKSGQLADVKKGRDDLDIIVKEIRAESSDLFLKTYNKIKKNFHKRFRRLFGGGRAALRQVDPNHVLESGIEIFAQPPGKKLESIALLSGGEKSMAAVALLFATYMVRPSPFCLLDEIDAALDEDNVGRFVNLLREFGERSQFIVITHNKKTVTGAQTLLGVTMAESGVTQMISTRLADERDEQEMVEDGSTASMFIDDDFVEEDVEEEDGRELPIGVDDPTTVSEADLRPLRSGSLAG
jgi:chromosome segregation protein